MIELVYIIPIAIILLLIIFVTLPTCFGLANIFFSFCFFIHKNLHRRRYKTSSPTEFWNGPLTVFARLYRLFGRIGHGYEIEGLEKIPASGPVVLILYHAETPSDAGFIQSEIFLKLGRKVIQIVDHIAFKIPGYKTFLEATEQTAGSVDSCVEMLEQGRLIGIYPGGVREGIIGDSSNYAVEWNKRTGFARVATAGKATIVPIFTRNCRQLFYRPPCFMDYFKRSYLKKKTPYTLVLGWFPVKLKTFVGDPIPYDESRTFQELADQTKSAMEQLIANHQPLPGSILRALGERLC